MFAALIRWMFRREWPVFTLQLRAQIQQRIGADGQLAADLMMPMAIEAKVLDRVVLSKIGRTRPRPRSRSNGLFSPIERNLS